jgi:hypothetical protein
LKLIFLVVSRAVSLLGLSRREWWWKDAEILMLRHLCRPNTRFHSWSALSAAAGRWRWLADQVPLTIVYLLVRRVLNLAVLFSRRDLARTLNC